MLSSDPLQSEHKIQSGKGSLHIEMDQVPKILKPLVSEWTHGQAYIVSFKAGSIASPSRIASHHVYSLRPIHHYSFLKLAKRSRATATRLSLEMICTHASTRLCSYRPRN